MDTHRHYISAFEHLNYAARKKNAVSSDMVIVIIPFSSCQLAFSGYPD
jgi:hypothetical protein